MRSALLILVILSSVVRADFTFVHVSDIHVGAGENAKTDAALFDEIAALHPAFVVNTGDVCEYGTDAEYAQYRDVLKSLGDVKSYVAPGNHDVRWNPRGKEGFTRGVGGPLYQSWDHENVHFVLLDSTVLLEHWGHISAEQLRWLAADLKNVGTDRPVVIGFHHWVGRETVQVDNEQALLDCVAPYNVVLWLQGHGHADIEWNVNGAPATMVKGLYQGSYDVVRVSGDALTITKRLIPDAKRGELIQDKSVPDPTTRPTTRAVATVPMKRCDVPELAIKASLGVHETGLFVHLAAPPGVQAQLRVDRGPAAPLKLMEDKRGRFAYYAPYDVPASMTAGIHLATVQFTLADGRVFTRSCVFEKDGDVSPEWSVNVSAEVQSRLVKSADTLYISTMSNDLVALSATDGKERFRVKTGGPIFTAAALADGTLYFGSADHFVYAADATTGAITWKHETNGAVLAGPAVAKGVVCVGSTDTTVYGLDARTGNVRWTVAGANMFQSATTTDGDRFFVGGWDNHFRCIDAATGKVTWDVELGRKQRPGFSAFAPAITAPVVGDGKVFVSTNDGILHALTIADGSAAWRIDWKKMGYSAPLFHNGRVYAALSDEGKVFCADAATGKLKWMAETSSVIYDSSFCIGGTPGHERVFIGNVNGTMNGLDAATGKDLRQYRLPPGHLLGSPVADKRFVYVGSMSGQVVALPIAP